MNYSRAVMLINENIRAIHVSYKQNSDGTPAGVYEFKTLDSSIKKGDFVAVPTQNADHYMTVCRVEDVDIDIDYENPIELKWVSDKIDLSTVGTILSEESKWVEQLKAAEKRRKREEIKKSMAEMYNDEDFKVDALPIANMAGQSQLEVQTPKKEES